MRRRLGELLLAEGIITQAQLDEALDRQKQMGMKLGEYLEHTGLLTEEKLIDVLQKQLKLKVIDLDSLHIKDEIISLISEETAERFSLLPIGLENGRLLLAMRDPLDYFALEEVKKIVGLQVIPVITQRKKLENSIKKYYGKSVAEKAIGEFVKQNFSQAKEESEVQDDEGNTPIMRFINTILENAIRRKASDIHIEPDMDELRIRYRIDGVLVEAMKTDIETAPSIVGRMKIISGLNITEKRKPQDGRSQFTVDGRRVDLRVSTLPVSSGEKVVIRILDKNNFTLGRESLGFSDEENRIFEKMVEKPHGIVLVTGPTGSGKTTTLYTALNELNTPEKNIVTVEDPIEYDFKGINQVQINHSVGLTFASGLRSILRQDPNIIMVGEIRDAETAQIALRAALTGHLVLSTLHTNDSMSAVARLMDMGIEPFLLSTTLVGVISQRLVRKVCPKCGVDHVATDAQKRLLGHDLEEELVIKRGGGCEYCSHTGYKGRIALFEMVEFDGEIKKAVEQGASHSELITLVETKEVKLLKDKGAEKVIDGTTTLEEYLRVTYL